MLKKRHSTRGSLVVMGKLLKQLRARSDCYELEETRYDVVLIRRVQQDDEFAGLVRHLLDKGGDDFVVLPVTDKKARYERVILLPLGGLPAL